MNNPNSDSILSPEEIKNLVYNPKSRGGQDFKKDPNLENLDKFKTVENPKLPFFSRSIPKLLIVALLACPVFILALLFTSDFGNSAKTVAQTVADSANEEIESENESLQKQLDEMQIQNAVLLQDFEELQAQKNKVKFVKTKSPPPEPVKIAKAEIKPEPQPQPQPPKPVESTKPNPQPKTVPVDPYEEWNLYANLGATQGDGFTEEETNIGSDTNTVPDERAVSPQNQENIPQTIVKADTSGSIPATLIGNANSSVAANTESYRGLENTNQAKDLLSPEAQNALFPEINSGNSFLEAKRREYQRQDAPDSESVSNPQSSETFLEAKRREYQQQDAPDSESVSNPQSSETFLEAKRREYQQQDALDSESVSNPQSENKQARYYGDHKPPSSVSSAQNVKIGSRITGEVSQSISWIEGNDPQVRGVINFSEDLLDDNGSVALPKNSSIIVEIEPERSGVVDFKVIGISYTNNQDQLIQESIDPDILLVQDKDGSPLTLKSKISGGEIPGQDALTDFLGDQSRTARRVLNEVEDISNRRNNSQRETYELEEGTELTIVVNGFLKVNK